jgi:hypothetical protein
MTGSRAQETGTRARGTGWMKGSCTLDYTDLSAMQAGGSRHWNIDRGGLG